MCERHCTELQSRQRETAHAFPRSAAGGSPPAGRRRSARRGVRVATPSSPCRGGRRGRRTRRTQGLRDSGRSRPRPASASRCGAGRRRRRSCTASRRGMRAAGPCGPGRGPCRPGRRRGRRTPAAPAG
ncbi:hypothetical protein BJ996_007076 [Streptomyces phaeogriseichromatogenes]|nr:hypothetical protein [Streptomyces murinus]